MIRAFIIVALALFVSSAYGQRFVKTFNTIDEAYNANLKDVHTNIFILGRSAVNDGGGGLFYYDSSSTTTNLGLVFGNTRGGRVKRVYTPGYVEAAWFGAKGDPSIDSTAAIQGAIDAVVYGTVKLTGTNSVSNISIKRGITLRGDHKWNTCLKPVAGTSGWMVTLDELSGAQVNTEFNTVGSLIENLSLEGGNRVTDLGGIYINHCDYLVVRNVNVWRFQRSGVYLNTSVRESLFDDVSVRFCGKRDATNNYGSGWPAFSLVNQETSTGSVEDVHNGISLRKCEVVFSLGDAVQVDTRQIPTVGRKVNNITLEDCWIHGWSDRFYGVEFSNALTNSATLRQYDLVKIGAAYDVRIKNSRISYTGQGKPLITLSTSTLGGTPISGLTYNPENVQIVGNFLNSTYSSASIVSGEIGVKADAGSGVVSDNTGLYINQLYDVPSGFLDTRNRQSTLEGLSFDPSVGGYASGNMQDVGTSPFTIHVKARLPTSIPASAGALVSIGSSAGTATFPGFAIYYSSNGNIYPVLYGATISDRRIATIARTGLESLMGQVVDFVFTRSGTTFKVYLNGGEYQFVEEAYGSPPLWSASPSSTKWNLGAGVGTAWPSTIHEFRVANRALSASEVMTLSKGVSPSDMWGSTSTISSGLLTTGYKYRITAVTSGNFVAVGASANTVGVEFTATGSGGGTLLDASNTVVRLGWIVDPDLVGNSGTTVYDRTTNDGDGALVGNGVKWIKTVGAAAAATSSAPIDQPDRGYSWDGIQASSYIGGLSQQLGTDPFTIQTRVRWPTSSPTNNAGVFTLTTAAGSFAVNGCGLVLDSSGNLSFFLYGATASDFRLALVTPAKLAAYAGSPVNLTITRSGTTLAIYANGTALTYSEATSGSAPQWSSSVTTDRYNIGLFTSSQPWVSTISAFRVANRALNATEVAALNRGVGTADVWGSTTVLNSGTFTVGKRYRIVARAASDFTTVGAANNTVGTEFVATATGAGVLDASNTAQRIGWFLDVDLGNNTAGTALDRTANALHGTVVGSGLVQVPADPASSSGLSDGDKGDITVSGGGTGLNIDNSAVTYAKMQNTAAASVVLGRGAGAGAGSLQELTLGSGLSISGTTLSVSAGGGNVSLSGTPSAGQAAEWATSSTILGVGVTGTGNYVKSTSPTLTTPTLGAATATTINGVSISGSATPTLAVTGTASISGSNTGDQSGANPTASVGLTAVNGSASTFLRSDGAPALDVSISPTWTGAHTLSKNGALSLPTFSITGTPITGGTATTTKPLALIETSGASSTAWSTGGTMFGVNAPSGFAGRVFDFQANGVSTLNLSAAGTLSGVGNFTTAGNVIAGGALNISWLGRSEMLSPSDGVILLQNAANSDFTRLQLGGTSTSFPAIQRSGTTVAIKLADGSADAPLTASTVTATTFTGALVGNASTATALTSTLGVSAGGTGATTASAARDALSGAETTVASAATTDLGAVASDKVSITGTTTITSFGTAAAGIEREGRFTGALTLTHNATSLIIPGGASLTTAAGDRFGAYSLGSGNWVVTWYTKADGTAIVGGGGGAVATDTIWDAAGDLAVGTGSNTAARLAPPTKLAGQYLYYGPAGVEWVHPSTHYIYRQDFLINFIPYDWTALSSSGIQNGVNSEAGEVGILYLGTGAASNTYRHHYLGPNNQFALGCGRTVIEHKIKLPTVSDGTDTYTAYVGLYDHQTTPVDGAWFEYSHGVNSGNWQCKVANNSSTTTTANTSVAWNSGWNIFTIDANAGATEVKFYINGTLVGTETGANIPGSSRHSNIAHGIVKNVGTGQRYLYVGYTDVYVKY